jgi:hypothetical protein
VLVDGVFHRQIKERNLSGRWRGCTKREYVVFGINVLRRTRLEPGYQLSTRIKQNFIHDRFHRRIKYSDGTPLESID